MHFLQKLILDVNVVILFQRVEENYRKTNEQRKNKDEGKEKKYYFTNVLIIFILVT